jgi:parvulin-like peptidyl-prolyl isomerase
MPVGGISASSGVTSSGTSVDVVARIGDTDVTADDMRATIASLTPDEQAAVAADPVTLDKVIRTLLMERVVMKEILAKQWDQKPEVKAHLERVREMTLADMYLQSVSNPSDNYPSDAELHTAYDAHKGALMVPHQFLLTQIFIADPINAEKDVDDKAQAKLAGIAKELQQPGADFATIARNESDDKASAAQGGEMGWMKDEKMAPRIRAQAHILAKGAISPTVRLADGWHILKLLDSKDISVAPFDDVKVKLAQLLRAERARDNRLVYLNKLLGEHPVTINDDAVSNLLKKPDK